MRKGRLFCRRELLRGVSAALTVASAPALARAAIDPAEQKYPVITRALANELKSIEPSYAKHTKLYPCLATLTDGRQIDGVYMLDAGAFLKIDDLGNRIVLPLARVAHIEDSPTRLPAKIADHIYRAGEYGMGYYVFTLVFADGARLPCRTGDLVDFLDLPDGYSVHKVIRALPHVGQKVVPPGKPQGHAAAAVWCPFRAA